MYDLQGNYSKALTYYNKALKMRESKRHPALIATSLNNLGAIYLYQNDYKKALHYLKKALELRIEVNDRSNIASSYNNLGEVYLIQGELGKSKDSYQQAIDINKEIGHKRVEISSLGGMAKVYTQQKDLSQAMAYAQQALSLSKKLGIFKDICQNQLLVGELLYRQNRFQEAQIAARELVSLSSEKGMLEELKEAYHLLQICYSKTQQADSAFHYLKTYYAIKDSLWSLEKNENAERIKNNLELDFKEKELKIIKEKETLLAGKNQQQSHKIIILGAAALLLSLSTLGLFILYLRNQRFRHTIQKSLQKIHSQSINLLALNRDLESANKILEVRNQELHDSNQLLQQFAYTASHDLRGPIINLRQLSQIILDDQANLNPIHQQHLGFMVQSANRSLSLIDALLTYSAVGKNLPAPEILDLLDILKHIELSLQYQAKASKATFEYRNIIPIKAHASLCGQLFQNLMSNALKFKEPEVTPHLVIGFDASQQTFYVRDNGMGIDKSQSNKLFNMFDRAGQKGNIEGSGIGLATCKRIVEYYRGSIWYESQKDSGTTFYFTLPQAMLD
jgi:signal transduction histidine kinase